MDSTNSTEIHRRGFLAAAAAFTIVPARALGRAGAVAANSRINVAVIGVGSQGLRVMFDFLAFPEVQAVAVADPVRSAANYHQWGKSEFANRVHKLLEVNSGWEWLSPNASMLPLSSTFSVPAGVSGREPAQRIINGFNTRGGPADSRGCAACADYRVMFDKAKNIDAVVIGATDVHHAPAALDAMALGKHVFCQKPMAHSLPAARLMAEAARSSGVVTQVALPKQASEEIRRLREWISAGVIGPATRVDNWSNRPSWPQGLPRPTDAAPVAAEVSSSERFPDTFLKASIIHLDFPARDNLPPVKLTWYNGGLKPERPEALEADRRLPSEGIIFHGDKGLLLCDFNGGAREHYPKSPRESFVEPLKNLPRSPGTEREWLGAVKDPKAPKPGANFEFTSLVTKALHLGNLSVRTSERLTWDSASSTLGGAPAAQALAHPGYRKGWSV